MPDNKEFNKIKAVYGEDVVLLAKKLVPTPEPAVKHDAPFKPSKPAKSGV